METQVKRILKKYRLTEQVKEQNDYLTDITDGDIYTTFMSSKSKKNNNFTFIFNTDGVSKCSKSNMTIWPIYCAISEIPEGERFCLENIVIAGLSVGDSKPDFDVFMRPIIDEFLTLEQGINLAETKDEIDIVYLYVLYAVMDKPARADLLKLKSSNGEFGCLKCLQSGRNAKTSKSNTFETIYFVLKIKSYFILDGNIRIYPFQKDNPDGPLRTKESYETDLRTFSRGVLGSTIMNELNHFNPVENTCIDYMHSLLEGVVKGMFRLWFSPDFVFNDNFGRKKRNPFSMRQYIDQIDERLMKIKPPSFVPSAPRSVDLWNLWRAHEFLYFLIFYSLCVFHEIMEYDYYQHLMLLVIAMENLLKPKIKKNELKIIHKVLIKFVERFEQLYPERSMLSGVHELLHLVQCTKNFGPLNGCNCFEFEELNRLFLKLIKGNDLIGEEFIKLFSYLKVLNSYSSNSLTNSKFKEFINKNSAIKTSNLKHKSKNTFGKVIGNKKSILLRQFYFKI
jgi:hypothetical protein